MPLAVKERACLRDGVGDLVTHRGLHFSSLRQTASQLFLCPSNCPLVHRRGPHHWHRCVCNVTRELMRFLLLLLWPEIVQSWQAIRHATPELIHARTNVHLLCLAPRSFFLHLHHERPKLFRGIMPQLLHLCGGSSAELLRFEAALLRLGLMLLKPSNAFQDKRQARIEGITRARVTTSVIHTGNMSTPGCRCMFLVASASCFSGRTKARKAPGSGRVLLHLQSAGRDVTPSNGVNAGTIGGTVHVTHQRTSDIIKFVKKPCGVQRA
mmetsp:Transcript_34788/g.92892  ORF Transcript_34788/g.92892 Transcript_34788/m.92892 type:complete len:267 (+) Transcript_34788:2070-2870(+)